MLHNRESCLIPSHCPDHSNDVNPAYNDGVTLTPCIDCKRGYPVGELMLVVLCPQMYLCQDCHRKATREMKSP